MGQPYMEGVVPDRRYTHLDDPTRIFGNVKEFDGWPMALIINHFLEQDTTNLHVKLRFRRALLMSEEVGQIIKRERIVW